LQAQLDPSAAWKAQAEEARQRASQTYEDAHGAAAEAYDFAPSIDLKKAYRDTAKQVHPDLATDAADLERRTRFMADANRAYEACDLEALERILDEYQDGAEAVIGEGIGAELIRIIRQISLAKNRVTAIEQELAALRQSEIRLLQEQAEEKVQDGLDLLAELATAVREQIELAKEKHESLANEGAILA